MAGYWILVCGLSQRQFVVAQQTLTDEIGNDRFWLWIQPVDATH